MLIAFDKNEIDEIKKIIDEISNAAYRAEQKTYGKDIDDDNHPLWEELDAITENAVMLYDKFILD